MNRRFGIHAAGLATLGLLSSCNQVKDEESYAKQFSIALCDRIEECSKGSFEVEFSDMKDCVDDYEDYAEEQSEMMENYDCNFNLEAAKVCLKSLREASCGDLYEGDLDNECEEVWECEGFPFNDDLEYENY